VFLDIENNLFFFAIFEYKRIQAQFNIVVARTVMELNGT